MLGDFFGSLREFQGRLLFGFGFINRARFSRTASASFAIARGD